MLIWTTGIVFFLFFCIVISQYYLAKNRYKSKWYWRNSIKLSDLVFQVARCKYSEEFMFVVFNLSLCSNVKCVFQLIYHLPLLKRLKVSLDKMDDIIDNMPAKDILSLGDTHLGPVLSPFLCALLDQEDKHNINRFITSNLLTIKEMNSFCNLFAYKLCIQAGLTLEYDEEQIYEKKALLREQMAQENIEITGICFALVSHLIVKDARIGTLVNKETGNELTHDILKGIYPQSTKAGELLQLVLDVPEFRHDMRQEKVISKITPNYFLAQLEKQGTLIEVLDEINILPERAVNLYELPIKIQHSFLKIEQFYKNSAVNIGKIPEFLLRESWKFVRRVGFYAEKSRY